MIFGLGYIVWALLFAIAGINKRGGYLRALLLCLFLTPIIGLFLTIGGGSKNAKGCKHCGNKYNEAEYCGLCGKNEEGIVREGFKK